jgi:adenosylcobyric acid synthase
VRDPEHLESSHDESPGLGLLPVETTFTAPKTVVRVAATGAGTSRLFAGVAHVFAAYEIHLGHTAVRGRSRAVFRVVSRDGRPVAGRDGAVSEDMAVEGTYLHGVLADARVRRHLLTGLAERKGVAVDPRWGSGGGAGRYDRLADIVGGALDMSAVARLIGLSYPRIG